MARRKAAHSYRCLQSRFAQKSKALQAPNVLAANNDSVSGLISELQLNDESSGEFIWFPRLPAELQLQIWKDALPKCPFVKVKISCQNSSALAFADPAVFYTICCSGDSSQAWVKKLKDVRLSIVSQQSRSVYLEHCNILLPTWPGSSGGPQYLRFSDETVIMFLNLFRYPQNRQIFLAQRGGLLPGYLKSIKKIGVEPLDFTFRSSLFNPRLHLLFPNLKLVVAWTSRSDLGELEMQRLRTKLAKMGSFSNTEVVVRKLRGSFLTDL